MIFSKCAGSARTHRNSFSYQAYTVVAMSIAAFAFLLSNFAHGDSWVGLGLIALRAVNFAAALAGPLAVRDAIAALLGELIDQIVSGAGRRGCFLGNCAAELPRSDRAALARVRQGLGRTEAAFHAALERAEAAGQLRPGADASAIARFLTAGFQGLRLIGKVNPDRPVLEGIADTMLRCLR